ncbi:MAG: potassium transporter Kup [Gammaproteobacteria bacterium]|nr:MAG: potassium transporter Kup [Gammaproteobacteria bacterium]
MNAPNEFSCSDINRSHKSTNTASLTLAALGVVYGDIGTSPLYTFQEIFRPATGVMLDTPHIVGAVSTVFWALMIVVTCKYVFLILRADNRGEGGVLALSALAALSVGKNSWLHPWLLLLGLFGATLFYGDSIITPAISVLGAMEGLSVVTPKLSSFVVPITLGVLIALFLVQRKGTKAVGKVFGPLMMLWFLVLAISGIVHVIREPQILAAINPLRAIHFLAERGWSTFFIFGAVVLALTGAEALYADMGHFGRKPIQFAWVGMVLPALALNYMGQGALLITDPGAINNPFYNLFSAQFLWFAVFIAAAAAIIASQAVISGAYSMTRQAIQLGFLPRMSVQHTSADEAGQIYIPSVNWILLLGVIAAVLIFKTSPNLAAAYGIAVTLTMFITTLLTFFIMLYRWRLPKVVVFTITGLLLLVDVALVCGCMIKFFDGGWFPLVLGGFLFLLMTTWRRGREIVINTIHKEGVELKAFLVSLQTDRIQMSTRVAVYPVADPSIVPQALLHNLKHNQVLHERNIILTVRFANTPWVNESDRVHIETLNNNFWRVTLEFGFMEVPDVPKALSSCDSLGLRIPLFETSYFLSRETIVTTSGSGMVKWREHLFAGMSRNASGVVEFFRLPDNAVVELGTRLQI